MLHIHEVTAQCACVYTFKWGFHGNHFYFHCCDLPAAGCGKKLSWEMISWKHLKLWIHSKAWRVQGWLQVTLGDAGNHWFRSRQGSLREIGHNISSESSTEQQCKGIQGWIVLFLYNHKHMYMLSQSNTLELTRTECQTQYLETVWQTGREGSRLGNFTAESLCVWRWLKRHSDTTRPLNAHCFLPDSLYAYSHNGLGVLRVHPFKCKNRQSWVPNLWHFLPPSSPRDTRRTNTNLVNVLDPCHGHCCALKTQCDSDDDVCIRWDLNE